MSDFRAIKVMSRTNYQLEPDLASLWEADLVVGLLNAKAKVSPYPLRAAALRTLAQDFQGSTLRITEPKKHTLTDYRQPRLFQAAIRPRMAGDGGGDNPRLRIGDKKNLVIKAASPAYSETTVAPRFALNEKDTNDIEAAPLTLDSGAIEIAIPRTGSVTLRKWLQLGMDGRAEKWAPNDKVVGLFGKGSDIAVPVVVAEKAARVRLAPDGIEFDAVVKDPFDVASTPLMLTLLFTYDTSSGLGMFILKPVGGKDMPTLRASFDRLMTAFGRFHQSPIAVNVAPGPCPIFWVLANSSGVLTTGRDSIQVEPSALRVTLTTERTDSAAIPSVCRINVGTARLTLSELTIESQSVTLKRAASVNVYWQSAAPAVLDFSLVKHANPADPVPLIAETDAFGKELRSLYTAAGAWSEDKDAPLYAFIPLERGFLQLPTLRHDPKAEIKDPPPTPALNGLVRIRANDIKPSEPDIQVVAAESALIRLTKTRVGANDLAVEARLIGAVGTLSGTLFAAASSPSPENILPRLDSGPIAARPLDLIFGDDNAVGWQVDHSPVNTASLRTTPAEIRVAITGPEFPDDSEVAGCNPRVIAWLAHPSMALLSAMPATRTRASAALPLETRDLVPHEHVLRKAAPLTLRGRFGDASSPSIFPFLGGLAARTASLGWPWPTDDGNGAMEASEGLSAVSLVSLTLPGVEFRPPDPNGFSFASLEGSLRFDLPILGELFASANLPSPPAALGASRQASDPAPTALQPLSLAERWTKNAGRLSLTRTMNDRVTGWHSLETVATVAIKGIAEPYVWNTRVSIGEGNDALPLGAYLLNGEPAAGSVALAGLRKHFKITDSELVALPDATGSEISVTGWSVALRHDGDYQIDTRGIGQSRVPDHTSSGDAIEWRSVKYQETTAPAEHRVAASAPSLPFDFDGMACCVRFRDLPMVEGGGGFAFDVSSGIEGIARPDGTVFWRDTLPRATYEWSVFERAADGVPGSFVIKLGPLVFRPQRLASLTLRGDRTKATLSGLTVVGNIEPPATALIEDEEAPFVDDEPYASGSPVALEFSVDQGKATLLTVKAVAITADAITIGASPATVAFALEALPLYGPEPAKAAPADRQRLSMTLELSLAAAGGKLAAVTASGRVKAKLFGNSVELLSGDVGLTPTALTLTFENAPDPKLRSGLAIDRIVAGWGDIRKGTEPTIKMRGTVFVSAGPAHSPSSPAPTLARCALVEWTLGETARWFGATAAGEARIDHSEGSLTLEVTRDLASSDQFLAGWPLDGATLKLALACAVEQSHRPEKWPIANLLAGFAEIRCKRDSAHPLLDIRHRLSTDDHPMVWASTLSVTSQPLAITSAVAWPIESLSEAALPSGSFAARSDDWRDWQTDITIAHDKGTFIHKAAIGLIDVELEAGRLRQTGDSIELGRAWPFTALVSHELRRDANTAFKWTTLDEVMIASSSWFVNRCMEALEPNTASGHAFAARYQDDIALAQADKLFAPSAGVLIRALARAGIPTYEMAKAIAKEEQPKGLLIVGASLIDVETAASDGSAPSKGVTLAMPWLAPFESGSSLGVLSNIPQCPLAAPLKLSVSTYDLAGAYPHRLDTGSVVPFAAGDGSVRTLTALRDRLVGEPITPFTPVSQAIMFGPEDGKPVDEPADAKAWLARPIWLRTLAAWKYVLKQPDIGKAFHGRVRTILVAKAPEDADGKYRSLRLAVTHRGDEIALAAASSISSVAVPHANLVVLAADRVSIIPLTSGDASLLSANAASGADRGRLARLTFSVTPEPLAILAARIIDGAEEHGHLTHEHIAFLTRPAILRELPESRGLRNAGRTLFASPALAWPREAERLAAKATTAIALGEQRVIQDSDHSWSGEDRSFSVPARTFSLDEKFESASVLALGQRTLFRRSRERLLAPADRALIPIPPRPRVPLPDATAKALMPLRLDTIDGTKEKAIAAIQPGPFEVIATGRRPGTLAFHHEGLILAKSATPFDGVAARYGRPGDRGPAVWRQTRAPRSTVFQDVSDLDRRRGTFLAQDIVDDALKGKGAVLEKAVIAAGSLAVLRYTPEPADRTKAIIRSLLIVPVAEFLGVAELPDTIDLRVEARDDPWAEDPASSDPIAVLARLGFLSGAATGLRATLIVGSRRFGLSRLGWVRRVTLKYRQVTLSLSLGAERQAAAQALGNATGDTKVSILLDPGDPAPAPNPHVQHGTVDLAIDQRAGLLPGPSRVLSLPLPLSPALRSSLPIKPATAAFGDPSYDRALASKTVSNRGPGSVLLAIDRIEYDPSSALHVAAGVVDPGRDNPGGDRDVTWASVQPWGFSLGFDLVRKSAPDSPALPLRIASVVATDPDATRPRYAVDGGKAYAIAVADLRVSGEAMPFEPGDRIIVTAYWLAVSISVAATVVAEPVLAPPPSVFGVATRDNASGQERLTSALFASAPLPQFVEYPDLTGDLARGMVRRRGLFVWQFVPRVRLAGGEETAAIIKIDRTGGGQSPDGIEDFLKPTF
ncbi:hypothetical protein [Microvirga zambiensis]|uniref:hypothetical protein n=1 Tax=Microvirga zambiensis TaxID=1402137 RepID=UPI00191F7D6D|nr:hypothetical protein [Microvirga zambiensis]